MKESKRAKQSSDTMILGCLSKTDHHIVKSVRILWQLNLTLLLKGER